MKRIGLLISMLILSVVAMAQEEGTLIMDASSNGNTYTMVTTSGNYMLQIFPEKDASGNYLDGPYDRYIVIDTGDCEGETSMSLYFIEFDIDPSDTLFIYDSPTPTTLMFACNNNLNPQIQTTIFPSPLNSSGKLCIRFKTNGDGNSGSGFKIVVNCREKCEIVTPVIDSVFYKVRNGMIVDSGLARWCTQIDTNWNADSTHYTLDSQIFRGVHLCLGESLILKGHGDYTNYYGYGPADPWSMFEWNFGNGDDSSGIGLTRVPARYRDIDCYDVTLKITDSRGCKSTIMEAVKVRIAQNPIKTIYDLNPICTTDSIIVTTGEGSNFTIGTRKIEFAKTKSRSINCKTFIPDGPGADCPQGDAQKCFNAPILFDDFPAGRTVQSPADICSICINMEHEFLGDIGGRIICPTGQKAILWYGTTGKDPLLPNPPGPELDGMYNGGGRFLGMPYGGNSHHSYDEQCSGQVEKYCDSVCNIYGVGFDYCFSKNGNYQLRTGEMCNKANPTPADYFCYTTGDDTSITDYTFHQIPAPFVQAGTNPPTVSFPTKQPSNHEGQFNYYLPASDLSNLVGCPLNGEWAVQLCDNWGSDNGWIFSWALDFCGISSGAGCEYQVSIDSVIWEPDTTYGDFDLGYWRGVNIDNSNPTRSIISSHDTAGNFPINVHIYDNFGCVWDTVVGFKAVWAPTPELGEDRIICDVENVKLDASDVHQDSNYTYIWAPFGQETDTIRTTGGIGSSTLYTVEVKHREHGITCVTQDSVRININHQPVPNFDPGIYPLEGCEPYTLHFDNTSQFADSYLWVFGDGDSSRAQSPSHTYGTGQYSFKYFVSNVSGCNDSLVYEDLITVYSSPVARFSWEPMNPTVMHPSVTFQNMTVPQSDANKYYWEIQYDRDNPVSYHTMTDVNPTFEWWTDGEDISGNYVARLIAMTSNRGPSGKIVECRDTVENRILLVNDFLQFPNAVTPNGDGINDRFVIKNLIDGLGYPNNSLAIYDRWGKRIFYKENISRDEDFWDPSADNTPAGTYFWRFTGKGYLGDIQRNGVVEIVK